MVKVKLIDIANSINALGVLGNEKMGAMVSFKVAKVIKAVNKELSLYNAERKKLFDEYGESAGEGQLTLKKEYVEVATKELTELDEMEVELKVNKIPFAELQHVNISPSTFLLLEYIIQE